MTQILAIYQKVAPPHLGTCTRPANSSLHVALNRLQQTSNMQVAWVRLFYQFGPFENQLRLVPQVICSLLQNQEVKVSRGEQIRDFLHVEDVASAICTVLKSDLSGAVNIGSGTPVKLRDLVGSIGGLVGRQELIKIGALPYAPSESMFICQQSTATKYGMGTAI